MLIRTFHTKAAAIAALLFSFCMVLAPPARADIIEVEGSTSCPGSLGGGLCNGSSPFLLSALLLTLETPGSTGSGTQKYVVTNNLGSSYTISLGSTGQNNTGIANNGQCQVNGGAASFFNSCSITDNTGQTTSLGGPQINNMVFPITIKFTGPSATGATVDLGFVSMQGSSDVANFGGPGGSSVPEPSSLLLFGTAIAGLALRARQTAGGK